MRFTVPTVTLILLMLCSTILRAADDNRQRYSLLQSEPNIGSSIRRDAATGSVIPFDKRYAELSGDQQSYLKSQYEGMGADDEPPFPINGLSPIYKAIAAGQQKLQIKGNMTLAVEVNSQGEATSVSVLQSADPEMTQFAASILMLQKYKAAVCNGTPCTMQFPFRIAFEIRYAALDPPHINLSILAAP